MAPEILHAPETKSALPFDIQAVAANIAQAASVQGKESIDRALQSFEWVSIEKESGNDEWQALLGKTTIQTSGHADPPLKYFTHLHNAKKELNGNGIVSMDRLLSNLRRHDLNFQQGVASFLKSGIQEALSSFKISLEPNVSRPQIPVALDELISPDKMKNPDRERLQPALQVMNEMFSTIKNMQSDISNLRMNMLRSIRA
jgi:hypothetical protein